MLINLSSHTTETFQDEVELATCLEGIDEVDNEGMLDGLQDIPLSLCVGCILGITGNLGLQEIPRENWGYTQICNTVHREAKRHTAYLL